jgi:hypothetical protein
MRVWMDGSKFSSYVEDGKRILGQVIGPELNMHPGKWDARNNTKLNKSGTAALSLGLFASLADGKAAVEQAVAGE